MEIRETEADNSTKTEEKKMKRREVVVESLGWLTESTILPKKHRAIEGVGASSILELKAQLYKSQEEAKKSKELSSSSDLSYHRAKSKISSSGDPFSVKNSGVEARALKDKLELKAVNDGSASYAALEKKAELYEKLVRGELSDEEENEKYCVDFFRKQEENPPEQSGGSGAASAAEAVRQENEEADGVEDSMLFGMGFVAPGRTAGAVDRDEHKRFVRQVHEEASQAREKASERKLRRQAQAAAHREKLRQAYLRKKLEKIKSALNPEQM